MKNNDSDGSVRALLDRLGRPSLATLENEIARCERNEAYLRLARELLAGLVAAAAAIIIVTNLWVAVLRIDGSSMNPLLRRDEVVLAARGGSAGRNDVVAFYQNNQCHIKRVIAISGDSVEISGDGVVSVNGETLDEPYVAEQSLGSCDIKFPYLVPTGTVFVLGDNREASLDSRDSRFGPIPRDQITGRVMFTLWPLSRAGKINH